VDLNLRDSLFVKVIVIAEDNPGASKAPAKWGPSILPALQNVKVMKSVKIRNAKKRQKAVTLPAEGTKHATQTNVKKSLRAAIPNAKKVRSAKRTTALTASMTATVLNPAMGENATTKISVLPVYPMQIAAVTKNAKTKSAPKPPILDATLPVPLAKPAKTKNAWAVNQRVKEDKSVKTKNVSIAQVMTTASALAKANDARAITPVLLVLPIQIASAERRATMPSVSKRRFATILVVKTEKYAKKAKTGAWIV